MADSSVQTDEIEKQEEGTKLKHLGFVQAAVVLTLMYLSRVYNFAKSNAGPLRAGVQAVEDIVKAVVGPVYEKVHDVPLQLLGYVDRMVDDVLAEAEHHVPSLLKKVLQEARSIADEVLRIGVLATLVQLALAAKAKVHPLALDACSQCLPAVEKHAAAAWHFLNQLPVIPQIVQVAVPTVASWTEKYNEAVGSAAAKGFAVAQFLPLVPTERIAKVFGKKQM